MLVFALYLILFSIFGNMTNIPAVLQPSSTCQWFRLLTVRCQRFTNQPIVFCAVRPTHIVHLLWLCGQSLFFLLGLPPSFLSSRGFAARRSPASAPRLLNLKKKRDCSQSNGKDYKLLKSAKEFSITFYTSY